MLFKNSVDKIITPNFLALFGAVFLMFTAIDFYIPVLPFYVIDVGGDEASVGLLMGLFTFCSIVLRPFQGRDLNRSGKKRLLVMGMALYASAGLGLLFLPSLPFLYFFRAVQGFGWGAFLLTFNTLTLDLAPPEKRGEAVGLMGIAPPLSLAVAPLLSERLMITTAANYRLLFFITLGAALLALLLGVLFRDPAGKNKLAERAPLFSRKVLVPSLIIFCMTFNLGSLLTFLPLFGESRNIHAVGYFFTIFAITTIFSRPLAGKLSDRLGRPRVFLPGLLIAAVAMVILAFSHSALQLMLSAFVFGVGFGSAHSSVMAMAADRLAVLERGVGMATFTTAFDLGIVVGSVVLGFLLSLLGFTALFLLCALIMALPLFGFIIKYRTIFS